MANVIAPAGLAPGSQYQILFLTFSPTTALSSDIDDYNAFVAGEAAFGEAFGLPAGVTWHAVVSTPTINAKDNAPSGSLPVYSTHGDLLAPSTIYGGSLLAEVYDELGSHYNLWNAAVWTGSDPNGLGVPGQTLGNAGGFGAIGGPIAPGGLWMHSFPFDNGVPLGNTWAIYALSDPITFLPEPGTLTLLGSALAAFGGIRLLRGRWTK